LEPAYPGLVSETQVQQLIFDTSFVDFIRSKPVDSSITPSLGRSSLETQKALYQQY